MTLVCNLLLSHYVVQSYVHLYFILCVVIVNQLVCLFHYFDLGQLQFKKIKNKQEGKVPRIRRFKLRRYTNRMYFNKQCASIRSECSLNMECKININFRRSFIKVDKIHTKFHLNRHVSTKWNFAEM